jgi:uncharacterized membrane protein
MKKTEIVTIVAAALALSTAAIAEEAPQMEKCKVVNKAGKGLIKAHKGDCSTDKNSCAGDNDANNPQSWIMVPNGQCAKINAGNFDGVSEDIREAIEGAPSH